MSTSLERRIAKLEDAAHPEGNRIEVIIRRVLSTAGAEVARAIIGDAVVNRRTDETADAFIERSKAVALAATGRRPCRLTLLPADVLQ